MKRIAIVFGISALLVGMAALPVRADQTPEASGFKTDLLASIDDAGKKLVDLAQAVPAEKYGWRPSEGVRSFSEVFMHVVAGNYLIPSFMGFKRPEGVDRSIETKVTEKAKVIEWLQKSIADLKKTVEATPDADLDKKVKFFGSERTERGLLIIVCSHLHEHLGQAIAYARMNKIAPPWSEGEPKPPAPKSSP